MGVTSFVLEVADLGRSQNAEDVRVLQGGGDGRDGDQGDPSLFI